MPFIYEREYVFRCDNMRALYARLTPRIAARCPGIPDEIDWRRLLARRPHAGPGEVGLPEARGGVRREAARASTRYRDLLELFEATHHAATRQRVAMRWLRDGRRAASATPTPSCGTRRRAARSTCARAVCAGRQGDAARREPARVGHHLLRRPQGGRHRGAGRSPGDAPRRWRTSSLSAARARGDRLERKVRERLEARAPAGDAQSSLSRSSSQRRWREGGRRACSRHRSQGDELASLIFTSRHHRAAQGRDAVAPQLHVAAVASSRRVFDLDKHDGLLSVLPLHHTFEFTAGLLMPLVARRADRLPRRDRRPTRCATAFDDGQHHRHGRRAGAVAAAAPARSTSSVASAGRSAGDGVRAGRSSSTASCATSRRRASERRALFFGRCTSKLGGRAALADLAAARRCRRTTMKAFRGLGFNLYEGYGLTEAAPVLTVHGPGDSCSPGTVGRAAAGHRGEDRQPRRERRGRGDRQRART